MGGGGGGGAAGGGPIGSKNPCAVVSSVCCPSFSTEARSGADSSMFNIACNAEAWADDKRQKRVHGHGGGA